MKNLHFTGIDASNEISLLEYGLLVSTEQHEDNSGTYFVIYKQDSNTFGTGHISENDLNSILSGKDWAKDKDLNGFFSFVGCKSRQGYIKDGNMVNKLYDLINYFGVENIMGTDYSPITESEAIKLYLNNN